MLVPNQCWNLRHSVRGQQPKGRFHIGITVVLDAGKFNSKLVLARTLSCGAESPLVPAQIYQMHTAKQTYRDRERELSPTPRLSSSIQSQFWELLEILHIVFSAQNPQLQVLIWPEYKPVVSAGLDPNRQRLRPQKISTKSGFISEAPVRGQRLLNRRNTWRVH